MPRVPGVPTEGVLNFANIAAQQASQQLGRADQFNLVAYSEANRKQDAILRQLQLMADARRRRQAEKDAKKKSLFGGAGGAAGLGLGAGIGALLAIPTGGLSVVAGALIGGVVGGAAGATVDAVTAPDAASAAGFSNQAAGFTRQALGGLEQLQDNPYFEPVDTSGFFGGGNVSGIRPQGSIGGLNPDTGLDPKFGLPSSKLAAPLPTAQVPVGQSNAPPAAPLPPATAGNTPFAQPAATQTAAGGLGGTEESQRTITLENGETIAEPYPGYAQDVGMKEVAPGTFVRDLLNRGDFN